MAYVNFKKQARLPVKNWIKRTWHVVDARDQVVGRLATKLSTLVSGRHKPTYLPNVDDGDSVVVLNADKVKFTGDKWAQKLYRSHSGYPGGLKEVPAWRMRIKNPTFILKKAVNGMLPKNSFRSTRVRRLRMYTGDTHPHFLQTGPVQVQRPETLNEETMPDFDAQPWLRRFEPWEVQSVRPTLDAPENRWHKRPGKTPFPSRLGQLSKRERKLYDTWQSLLVEYKGDEEAILRDASQLTMDRLSSAVTVTSEL